MKGKRQVVFCGNQRKMTDKHMLARQRGASTRTILTWKSHKIMIIFGLFFDIIIKQNCKMLIFYPISSDEFKCVSLLGIEIGQTIIDNHSD